MSNVNIINNVGETAVNLRYSSITISDSLFKNNAGTIGGAMYVIGGTLSLNNVTFDGNSATGDGGAVSVIATDVEMNNVKMINNRALASTFSGGGLYSSSSLNFNVYNSYFFNNSAFSYGGALAFGQEGIYNVTGSVFESNTALVFNHFILFIAKYVTNLNVL